LSWFQKSMSRRWEKSSKGSTGQDILQILYRIYGTCQYFRNYTVQNYPFMDQFFNEVVFGYDTTLNPTIMAFLYSSFGLIVIIIIGAILLHFIYNFLIEHQRKKWSDTTYKLQLKLYKVLMLEICLAFIFFLIPLFIVALLLILQVRYSSFICMYLLWFITLHTIVESFLVVLYIKPYREYVKKLVMPAKLLFTNVTVVAPAHSAVPAHNSRVTVHIWKNKKFQFGNPTWGGPDFRFSMSPSCYIIKQCNFFLYP
jgi:hypothetical protein